MKLETEVVYIYLYDAGRSIDLMNVAAIVPADQTDSRGASGRDTPASLRLSRPLSVELAHLKAKDGIPFDSMRLNARVFEEGAISMCVRITGKFELAKFHKIRSTPIAIQGHETSIESWVDQSFRKFFARIRGAITLEPYVFAETVRDTYAAYCVGTDVGNPESFVRANGKTIACLLNGETSRTDLHASQIAATLKGSFSYRANDYALFDLDRCLIIDPEKNYEDILLVVEQAVFFLLELRSLDMLLDRWLDKAEDDITIEFTKNTARLKMVKAQLAGIQALGFDALFILENLENSTKIIGDYFLGQIFNNLCGQFDTVGWTKSIERRLSTLDSVYARVNANETDRRMLFLETMFIVVCAILPILQIIQAFIISR